MAEQNNVVIIMFKHFIHTIFTSSVAVVFKESVKTSRCLEVILFDISGSHNRRPVPLILIMKRVIRAEITGHKIPLYSVLSRDLIGYAVIEFLEPVNCYRLTAELCQA